MILLHVSTPGSGDALQLWFVARHMGVGLVHGLSFLVGGALFGLRAGVEVDGGRLQGGKTSEMAGN